jgi:hypothetical protein
MSSEPGEELRKAAKIMRNLASRCDAGPWRCRNLGRHDRSAVVTVAIGAPILLGSFEGARGGANGFHAAGMHPGVALAVADWLDAAAEHDDNGACNGGCGFGKAMVVARAYLAGTGQDLGHD